MRQRYVMYVSAVQCSMHACTRRIFFTSPYAFVCPLSAPRYVISQMVYCSLPAYQKCNQNKSFSCSSVSLGSQCIPSRAEIPSTADMHSSFQPARKEAWPAVHEIVVLRFKVNDILLYVQCFVTKDNLDCAASEHESV